MAYEKKTRRINLDPGNRPTAQENKRNRQESLGKWSKSVQVAKQKKRLLELISQGYPVTDACQLVDLTPATYAYYKRSDPDFRDESNLVMERRSGRNLPTNDIPFEVFSEKYLKQRLFRHQLQWIDLIEGREPRELHAGQRYEPGDPDFIIVNTPPGHAKSTTLTMNYVTYKIVTNPSFRVVVVSKTETMAKKFLAGIKRRLTNIYYRELIRDYAPQEGFEQSAEMWSASMIYFSHQEGGEKDPTVQALGIGQQIYGARADLIILDDVEDLRNVNEVEKHVEWIQQEVMTRDAPIICVGTRVGALDVYTELLNPKRYDDGESLWTYLTQPAVLHFGDEGPTGWVTLWPRSNQPHSRNPGVQDESGLWDKWTGPRLDKMRRGMSPRMWSLVYMQAKVEENSIFPETAVLGSMNKQRGVGMIPWGFAGYDVSRQYKQYIVAGLDPASATGYTAIVVLSVDRETGKRILLDVRNAHLTPEQMRREIRDVTERYAVNEWRVETNSFQSFLAQDRELNQYMAARGIRFQPHLTGRNKWDPAYGVASMSVLFTGWEDNYQLIDLPGRKTPESVRTLCEQLVTWSPDIPKTQRTDTVMALWFAEIRAREICTVEYKTEWMENDFLSDDDQENRVVVDIDDYLRDQRMYA